MNIDFRSLGVRLETRHLLKDGLEGDFDGLDIGGREGGVDVLVGHGGVPWVWFLWLWSTK